MSQNSRKRSMCNGYATIGLLAPLLVLIGRLLRDFRQGWNWAECRFICPRLLHRGTKALRELAVGQPVGSGDGRRACRRGAQLNSTAGENDSMGMARSTAARLRDHTVFVPGEAVAARDG